MLSKKEVNQLKTLLEREDLKAKKWLEDFIWRNTTEAKFKIGDIVKFSDNNRWHYGSKLVGFVGKVIEVEYWTNVMKIAYTIEYQYQLEGSTEIKTTNSTRMVEQIESKCRTLKVNVVKGDKTKNSDYMYL